MAKIFSSPNSVRLPTSKRVAQGEGSNHDLGGIVMCPQCHNLHHKKKWLHPDSLDLKKQILKKKICPACTMARDKTFEGEVLIKNVPPRHSKDLLNLVNSFGERAQKRDPQDRIIEIKKNKEAYRITTTENQTAVRLSKKIRDAFRSVDLEIKHSKEPAEVSRINVNFHTS